MRSETVSAACASSDLLTENGCLTMCYSSFLMSEVAVEIWKSGERGIMMSRKLVLLISVCSASIALPVHAQEAADPSDPNEIIVTAQRTSERLQDVPVAVSAFSNDSLERQQIDNPLELQLALPSTTLTYGNFSGTNITIRGIGSPVVAGRAGVQPARTRASSNGDERRARRVMPPTLAHLQVRADAPAKLCHQRPTRCLDTRRKPGHIPPRSGHFPNPTKDIRGSSNGRTADSDSAYQGSNPCPRTNTPFCALKRRTYLSETTRPCCLAVRTLASHAESPGSIPGRVIL